MPLKKHTIKIGNMCCARCIVAVKEVFNRSGIRYKRVELGSAVIAGPIGAKIKILEAGLKKAGFEIIISKEDDLTEKIKIAIHKIFFDAKLHDLNGFELKKYLEQQIGLPYKKLSEVFSKHKHQTIEKLFILHRIEKVKELIDEGASSFSEIAFKLGYNSLSHLSRQFRAEQGVSMQQYRSTPKNSRKFIDRL